jgi:hypothetical protein
MPITPIVLEDHQIERSYVVLDPANMEDEQAE